MPKLVTPNSQPALHLPPGSNHYRLVGLEVSSVSADGCNGGASRKENCFTYQLISAASVPRSPLVDSVVVDRCYIHGSPTEDVRRGVQANGSNIAVIDSYISDIHQSTSDSQAIVAWYSPGPVKIVNNYLEATGENVMFGGAGGLDNPWVPSDIEIRNNYFFKPLSWAQVGVTIPPGNRWAVKNHLEFKSARRVLVDGNVFENVWVSAQMGYSIVLTPRTNATGGSGLLAVVDDITIRNNILKNVSSGFDALAHDGPPNCVPSNGCTSVGEQKRVILYNNLIMLGDTTQPGYTNGAVFGGLILLDMTDFIAPAQHRDRSAESRVLQRVVLLRYFGNCTLQSSVFADKQCLGSG